MDRRTQVISELSALQTSTPEKFKALAYKKAIESIRGMTEPLVTASQLKDMPGIGKKIYEKVETIINTGALRVTPVDDIHSILLGVHGIGPVKARELVAAGVTSIADLSTKQQLLNDTQKMGLKYYEHGLQRIPRTEMTQHETHLKMYIPAGLTGTIVGSYRREAPHSGDIDMVLTYPDAVTESYAQTLFGRFVYNLTSTGYIVDTLASGPKKWMGYVRLAGDGAIHRRLDLLLTPPHEYPFALLYFTGSDQFNIAFRRWCLQKGYTLNEHRIMPLNSETPVPTIMRSEEDIFRFVGLKYVSPSERVHANLNVAT
jgi:DNA polymerase IV